MKKFIPWLAAAATLLIIFGAIYGTVQQAQRQDANYPQIQIAEDTAAALNQGRDASLFTQQQVDMAASLAPFVILYDKQGQPVSGTGLLNGHLPAVPRGVLDAAQGKPYHAVTWQPEANVRIAAVVVAAKNNYVLSGRSLKEIEKNENKTFQIAFLGGIASWLVLLGTFAVMQTIRTKK